MTAAALADQNELSSLLTEQNDIITFLKDREGPVKQKIIRMAEILEQRMERADPELPKFLTINMISTEITRIFRENGIAAANNVNHYLPEKYKDPSQQRIVLVDGSIRTADDIEIIKELGKNPRLLAEAISKMYDHEDLQTVFEISDLIKKTVASRAMECGLILVGFENKKKHETPHGKQEINTCWEAMNYGIEEVLPGVRDFFYEYPPPTREKEMKWASGILELWDLFPTIRNKKQSLIKTMWMSRIKYMSHQSKHGAAVKDPIMTMLCENCYDIKTGREKPDCNAEMVRDITSPTGFRCGSCHGVQGHLRGLTREQVGDNKEPVITQCERFLNNIPYFFDMIEETYQDSYMPYGYARKIDLGVELSDKS